MSSTSVLRSCIRNRRHHTETYDVHIHSSSINGLFESDTLRNRWNLQSNVKVAVKKLQKFIEGVSTVSFEMYAVETLSIDVDMISLEISKIIATDVYGDSMEFDLKNIDTYFCEYFDYYVEDDTCASNV